MSERNKDVMVYRFDRKKRYFIVSLHLENKPGALGNIANLLAIRGMNILEGFFGGITYGSKGNVGFFLESTNTKMDEAWLKDLLESSVYVSEVEVKSAVEGFISDSLNFPVTWNNGDRAVLMKVEGLKAMLSAVRSANPNAGDASIYAQGFSYGKESWEKLIGEHRPTSKEGLAEMLKIYAATGWGRLELADLDVGRRRARVRLSDGFECVGESTGKPAGHFISGHIAGAFSAYFGAEVKAVETKCVSSGGTHCEFVISP